MRALLMYQLSVNNDILEGVSFEYSKRTGRLRRVLSNGRLLATVRATDGFLVPSLEGAKKLLKTLDKYTVMVSDEAVPFVTSGHSVFCKHVIWASREIRAGDEVMVVDRHGKLLAIGKAVISGEEMVVKKVGVGVRVRRGVYSDKRTPTSSKPLAT